MRKALRKAGASCVLRVAEDGVEALRILAGKGYQPDLVLLDLNLPKISGKGVLRRMKSDPALRTLPVIVLSGSRSPEDIAECYALCANGYLVKPGDAAAYLEMVRSLGTFWFNHAALPLR